MPGLLSHGRGAAGMTRADGDPLPRHRNNFGVIRLALASVVVLGHATEIAGPGDPGRDLLFRYSGTVYVAGTCVFGFFLLSGYLITQSMVGTKAAGPYLAKRALRIVPGFVVAYLLSVFVLAPALGAEVRPLLKQVLVDFLFLHEPPPLLGAVEPHYRTINGSLWTISYEVRCYLLVLALWFVGLLRRRAVVASLAAVLCALTCLMYAGGLGAEVDRLAASRPVALIVGMPTWGIAYGAAFLVGGAVFLYRDAVLPRLNGTVASMAVVALAVVLPVEPLALVGLTLLGGVALFWLALKADLGPLQKVNDRWDISYGVYLYGWPCTMVVLIAYPSVSAALLGLAALLLAVLCGCASWWGLERHFKLPSRAGSRGAIETERARA